MYKCIVCGKKSDDRNDFDEVMLCRNCKSGKQGGKK